MRNGQIAECVLSMVTTRDHAAAAVGDLVESGVGARRLWSAVGSRILRSVDARTLAITVVAFALQYPLFFLTMRALPQARWFTVPPVVSSCVVTEMLVGGAIGMYGQAMPLTACLLLVFCDCALGGFKVNGVQVSLAIWPVPLLQA